MAGSKRERDEIVLLVRGSIHRCVAIAARVIARHHIDVVVGFSWGGGIACWLLAERNKWRGPTLLLAPTVAAMSGIARLAKPRFLASAESASDEPAAPLVHVVHAMYDGFCPASQHEYFAATGAAMHLCDDIHIFSHTRDAPKIGSSRIMRVILAQGPAAHTGGARACVAVSA